jgi:hypothetical protein
MKYDKKIKDEHHTAQYFLVTTKSKVVKSIANDSGTAL